MKLAEAMMLGGMTHELYPYSWKTCLLGVSMQALGEARVSSGEILARWPWIQNTAVSPRIGKFTSTWAGKTFPIRNIISNLAVDVYHGYATLDEVVAWVASVEPADPEVVTTETEVMRSELCEAVSH